MLSDGGDTRGAMATEAMAIEAVTREAVAKAKWLRRQSTPLRRLESVRRVGAVRQFGAAAAPPVSATAARSSAEYREDGTVHRGVDSGQYSEQDGTMHWLRESFASEYSGEDQQSVAALGKRGWERSGLSFSTPTPLSFSTPTPTPNPNPEPHPDPDH